MKPIPLASTLLAVTLLLTPGFASLTAADAGVWPIEEATLDATPASVAWSQDLDGAAAKYSLSWTRNVRVHSAAAHGAGEITVSVSGAHEIVDAAGTTQPTRAYFFNAVGHADYAAHQWSEFDGTATYALDPVSGAVVQTRIDADVSWTSSSSPRLRLESLFNPESTFEAADGLLLLVRALDSLAGTSFTEGARLAPGPGPVWFVNAHSLEDIVLAPPTGRDGRPGNEGIVRALPLDFVLAPQAGVELSGTAYVEDGASLPAKLVLRYHAVADAHDLATVTLSRVGNATAGASLPDLPAFTPPGTHALAEHAPIHSTGTRAASWGPAPTIEEVLTLAEASDEVKAYRAAYPGAFVQSLRNQDQFRLAARANVASPLAGETIATVWGYPLWMISWYAEEDPGVRLVTAVYPDRLGGFTVANTVQPGFPPPTQPAAKLTTSSMLAILESFHAAFEEDGSSERAILAAAQPAFWLLLRGSGLDVEALAEDPAGLVNVLNPELGYVCAYPPPQAGIMGAVGNDDGNLIGYIRATYHTPRVSDPVATTRCQASFRGLDPLNPGIVVRTVTTADGAARAASSYVDHPQRPRAPVLIESDAWFDLPSSVSGVAGGSGTRTDPYVISGWNLRATSQTPGVTLRGTTKHVIVKDNVIHGGGVGVLLEEAQNVRVEGNRFIASDAAVVLAGARDIRVEDNVVTHSGAGIVIQSRVSLNPDYTLTTIPAERVVMEGNRFDLTNVGVAAIGLYGRVGDIVVRENTASRGIVGFWGESIEDTLLDGNAFHAMELAVELGDSHHGIRIVGGEVSGSEFAGVRIRGGAATLENVHILDSEGVGLLALGASVRVEGGAFDANRRGLVALQGSAVTASGVAFVGASEFAAYASASTLDATGSFWGAPDGPGGCGHGAGGRISCGITYSPWLAGAPA